MLKCPKCNSDKITTSDVVLTSYPCQYQHTCQVCSHYFTTTGKADCSSPTLQCSDCSYLRGKSSDSFCVVKSRLTDPKDSACGRYLSISDLLRVAYYATSDSRSGWICPRCSKVHSPDVKGCDCPMPVKEFIDKMRPSTPLADQWSTNNPCDTCPTNSKNGGSGMCGCTLNKDYKITCKTSEGTPSQVTQDMFVPVRQGKEGPG